MRAEAALLPGERTALARASLADALDTGFADRTTDPRALARVALMAHMAGRSEAALALARRVTLAADESDAGVEARRIAELIVSLERWWRADPDLAFLPPAASAEDSDPVVVLGAAAWVFTRTNLYQPADADWDELQRMLARARDGADSWLGRTGTAAGLADGIAAALHAAASAFLTERADWAAGFLDRLRRAVIRHRLNAWLPILDMFAGFAAQQLGRFAEARQRLADAIRLLRRDPASPYLPIALATQVVVWEYLGDERGSRELADIELELVAGAWRTTDMIARNTAVHLLGLGLAQRGDLEGAARLVGLLGPIESQPLVHEDRVRAYEILAQAALARGDREEAMRIRAHLTTLYASQSQGGALARLDTLLGAPDADPLRYAEASGVAGELLRARFTLIAAAVAGGTRAAALQELAALDSLAFQLRVSGMRVRAVRLFQTASASTPLTRRQLEVATLAAVGLTNKEIGTQLHLSPRTVESHVREALDALGLERRSQFAGARLPVRIGAAARRATLTMRQGQVAALVAAGSTNAEAAAALGLSEKTVEKHVSGLLTALDVGSRAGIAAAVLGAAEGVTVRA